MKKVLLSLHPEWAKEIFVTKRKKIEVRKSRPKLELPFEVLVYQTKDKGKSRVSEVFNSVYGGGKVIGSFVCDRIREIIPLGLRGFKLGTEWLKEMCLSKEQLDEYGGLKTLYSWHITEPKLFDKPRALGEFWAYNAELHKRFANEEDFCCYNGTNEYGELLNECAIFNTDIKRCYSCWEEWSGWCHRIKRPPQSYCYVEELG